MYNLTHGSIHINPLTIVIALYTINIISRVNSSVTANHYTNNQRNNINNIPTPMLLVVKVEIVDEI